MSWRLRSPIASLKYGSAAAHMKKGPVPSQDGNFGPPIPGRTPSRPKVFVIGKLSSYILASGICAETRVHPSSQSIPFGDYAARSACKIRAEVSAPIGQPVPKQSEGGPHL